MNITHFFLKLNLPMRVGFMPTFGRLLFFLSAGMNYFFSLPYAYAEASEPTFFYLAPKRNDLLRHMQDIEAKLRTRTDRPFKMKFVEFRGQTQEMPLENTANILRELAKQKPLAIISPNLDMAKAAARYQVPVQVVVSSLADPIGHGVVSRLSQHSENITGYTFAVDQIDEKRMSLLKEIAPKTKRVGILIDSIIKQQRLVRNQGQFSYNVDGVEVVPFVADSADVALQFIQQSKSLKIDAWYVRLMLPNFDDANKTKMVEAVNQQKLPSIYETMRFVELGGMAAYQSVIVDQLDTWARSLQLLLEGVAAKDIPIERPRHFFLSVNTAQTERLGLVLSRQFLRRVDLQFPCAVKPPMSCSKAMPQQF
jgi:putative tryptophan/tyrosine transport system substrate-binding protein